MYLGIDLGTTNSAIAGYINSDVRVFKTSDGADVLPSVIYIDKRGHRLFGQRAYAQTLLSPDNVAAGFKRVMGTSTKLEFAASGQELSPEEGSAEIIRQLIGQAFTETGEKEATGTVITIPAAFNQMQSEATIRAAKMIGLDKIALIQEPIAASMAAMSQINCKNGQFLVYDLGGGTFDLALVQSLSGSVNVIAHEGINMLGGRDFDRLIVNNIVRPWLLDNFDLPEDFQKNSKYRKVIRIAQLSTEKAKIALSTHPSEVIFASDEEIRVTDESGEDIFLEIDLTRELLEKLVSESIDQTIDLSRKILKDNGYSNEDIDRIVFIGGPTKMPALRNMVPQELGIPADLKTDPMTAVAIGAAIYCESRDWSKSTTSRKASRESLKSSGKLDLTYDFSARTSDDRAIIKVKTPDNENLETYELQIDSVNGWTSGRKKICVDMSIEVPVHDIGENSFRIMVFDSSGQPISDSLVDFKITRTHSSAAGIPATQTISVKVREDLESNKNILDTLIKKGTLLPASDTVNFRAAKDLKAGNNSSLDFELYQDEGVPEPELNLCVGVFRVSGNDLPEGVSIRAGDEIIFNWEMNDSGLLTATVDLPSVGQSFNTPKFYVDQAGHQSFDLNHGSQLAEAVLQKAEQDIEEAEHALGASVSSNALDINKQIQAQRETLELAQDNDTLRQITETARHIRQDIARLRLSPENRAKILEREISQFKSEYNQYCRESGDRGISDRFDDHAIKAQRAITNNNGKGLKEAEAHLREMEIIYFRQLWQDPSFIVHMFQSVMQEEYSTSDKAMFNKLVKHGSEALEQNDTDELRRTLFKIYDIQIAMGTGNETMAKVASIMRA